MKGFIYKISRVGGETEDCYIGSTINAKMRWQRHRSMLRGQYHENEILQRAWDKHLEEKFEFIILDTQEFESEAELIAREQFFIDQIRPRYNIAKVAGKPPSDAARSSKAAIEMHKNGILGNDKKPVVMVDVSSDAVVNTYPSAASAEKDGYASTCVGACSRGQRETHKGFKWKFANGTSPGFVAKPRVRKEVVRYDPKTGDEIERYNSIAEAAKQGYSESAICSCISGRRRMHGGFGWRCPDDSSHAIRPHGQSKSVLSYSLDDGSVIKRYNSVTSVVQDGFEQGKVSDCCNGHRKSHKGLGWAFSDEQIPSILKPARKVSAVESFDLKSGKTIRRYSNAAQAAAAEGFSCGNIRMCLYGNRRQCGGVGWRYTEENGASS